MAVVDRSRNNGGIGMFNRSKVKTYTETKDGNASGEDFASDKARAIQQGQQDKRENSLGAKLVNKLGQSLENASTTASGKNTGKALQGKSTESKAVATPNNQKSNGLMRRELTPGKDKGNLTMYNERTPIGRAKPAQKKEK